MESGDTAPPTWLRGRTAYPAPRKGPWRLVVRQSRCTALSAGRSANQALECPPGLRRIIFFAVIGPDTVPKLPSRTRSRRRADNLIISVTVSPASSSYRRSARPVAVRARPCLSVIGVRTGRGAQNREGVMGCIDKAEFISHRDAGDATRRDAMGGGRESVSVRRAPLSHVTDLYSPSINGVAAPPPRADPAPAISSVDTLSGCHCVNRDHSITALGAPMAPPKFDLWPSECRIARFKFRNGSTLRRLSSVPARTRNKLARGRGGRCSLLQSTGDNLAARREL